MIDVHKLPHFTRDVTGQHYRPVPSDVSLPRLSERRRRLKFRLTSSLVRLAFLCFRQINSRYTRTAEFPCKSRHVFVFVEKTCSFSTLNNTFERFRSKNSQSFHVLSSLLVQCGRRRRVNVLITLQISNG